MKILVEKILRFMQEVIMTLSTIAIIPLNNQTFRIVIVPG
jgi:hypothetical protein